jgi:hypothetical protein
MIAMTTLMTIPTTENSFAMASFATRSASGLSVVALESDAAPCELGGTYSKIYASAVNDSGDVAFSVSLSESATSSAILLKSGDITRVVLRSSEDAPGAGKYKRFADLDLTLLRTERFEDDVLLFRAELEGGSAAEGIFLRTPEGVEAVALAGGKSPRGNTYKSFSQLTIDSLTGSAFRLAFIAMMEDGKKSIIIKQSFGTTTPVEILSTGDLLGKEIVEDLVISRIGLSLSCVAKMRKPSKKRITEVIVVDSGFILHGGSLREGVRVPSLGKLKRILVPPAVNFQDGFVAVQFKGGASGLAQRTVFGDSQIFAKTGDPAPGLLGETIQSFAPPVSNSLAPNAPGFSDRFGIVSTVELSGGLVALWVGFFTNKAPLEGEATLMLVGGNISSDGQNYFLRLFSPVKLNNHGVLLLRGTIVNGEASREGIFLIDGLF